jgi:hypothetical protein
MFVNPFFFGLKNTHQIISESGNQTQEKKKKKAHYHLLTLSQPISKCRMTMDHPQQTNSSKKHYTTHSSMKERKKDLWMID